MLKKFSIITIVLLGSFSIVYAAPFFRYERSLLPVDSTENLGTTTAPWDELYINEICFTADTCETEWPAGGAGGGDSVWSRTAAGLIYAPTTTDSVAIGGTATTSAATEFWFDPVNNKFIVTSGKIGIGTTSPYAALSVVGEVVGRNFTSTSTSVNKFRGNTSIGDTTPISPLSLDSSVGNKIDVWQDGTNRYGIGIQSNLFQFYTSGTNADISFGHGNSDSFNRNVTFTGTGNVGIGTTSPYAKLSVVGQAVAAYFTATTTATSTLPQLDVTGIQSSTYADFDFLTSALVSTDAGGILIEYAGTSCTNQFVRSLSALGAATCATVVATDVDLADLTATDSTLTFSGTYDGQTARTIGLNLGNANTWTAKQNFYGGASTTLLSANYLQVGGTATTTISTAGNVSLPAAGTLTIPALTSAITLTDANGLFAEYAGSGCTNQVAEDLSAVGVINCVSINNGYWSGTDLSVANGGTGVSTFGGTNTILYTTAADTLASEAAFLYDPSINKFTVDNASTTLLSIGGVNVSPFQYQSFTYATTTWTATTTIPLEVGYGETWNSIRCFTSAGTLNVDLYHGSSHLTLLNASTTKGTFTFTTNKTIADGASVYADVGTPASSPRTITCTIKKQIN